MKDLIKKQKIMLNRFLSWSDFGIEREERVELENLISKVRKETAEKVCDRMPKKQRGNEHRCCGDNNTNGFNQCVEKIEEIKQQILKELL